MRKGSFMTNKIRKISWVDPTTLFDIQVEKILLCEIRNTLLWIAKYKSQSKQWQGRSLPTVTHQFKRWSWNERHCSLKEAHKVILNFFIRRELLSDLFKSLYLTKHYYIWTFQHSLQCPKISRYHLETAKF